MKNRIKIFYAMEIARKFRIRHIYIVRSFSSTGRKFLLYKKPQFKAEVFDCQLNLLNH